MRTRFLGRGSFRPAQRSPPPSRPRSRRQTPPSGFHSFPFLGSARPGFPAVLAPLEELVIHPIRREAREAGGEIPADALLPEVEVQPRLAALAEGQKILLPVRCPPEALVLAAGILYPHTGTPVALLPELEGQGFTRGKAARRPVVDPDDGVPRRGRAAVRRERRPLRQSPSPAASSSASSAARYRRRWAMRAPVAPALVLSMAASLRRLWAADFSLSYHVSPEKAPYRR